MILKTQENDIYLTGLQKKYLKFQILDLKMLKLDNWFVIGEGNRHIVISNGEKVLRIEKEVSMNTLNNANDLLKFHQETVYTLLKEYICPQIITCVSIDSLKKFKQIDTSEQQIDKLFFLETTCLTSEFSVELKPKCLTEEFVLKQISRGDNPVFNPWSLWKSKNENEIRSSLQNAKLHSKRYLKIHSWSETSFDPLNLVSQALLTFEGKILMNKLLKIQNMGTNRILKIVHKLLEFIDENEISCPQPIDLIGEEELLLEGKILLKNVREGHINKKSLNKIIKFIQTFLTGRMAMDVSLMFNFFPSKSYYKSNRLSYHLKKINLTGGWVCTIGVVDTDLKCASKIKNYYSKLN